MTVAIVLFMIGGLIGLVLGGELLVRGASKIAAALGISPLVIGLTIVAFGTSAPELVVSLRASFAGQAGLAVANVVGSNIFNILFILGACAIYAPLTVSSQLVRLDVPVMIIASVAMMFFSINGVIGFGEGIFLFSGIVLYTIFLVYKSRTEVKEKTEEKPEPITSGMMILNLFYIALGLGLLVIGGGWLVSSATEMARALGISETVIGLTIVAIGTSLPEVATSLIATFKGERDIAIGNVVGSNIFNVMLILGSSAMMTPSGLIVSNEMLNVDIPLMIGTTVACLPIFIVGFRINRWEGVMFFMVYALYTTYLILNATDHTFFESYQNGLLYIVGPLLLFTLSVISFQAVKQVKNHRRNRSSKV